MINSYDQLKAERAREAQDEYYSFITEYPDSKHKNAAENMGKAIKKVLQSEE